MAFSRESSSSESSGQQAKRSSSFRAKIAGIGKALSSSALTQKKPEQGQYLLLCRKNSFTKRTSF
eukprot:CAMPEP_0171495398 /NCGR_PEP_ID=MMETSP0958-20121227/6126_1 /TAXON_ID=87120 /ORGANISM="Aurantiochytrium limacinum, Strain ATCCMYA-1381" /LENGTH=64 /DNA_ID=CAMNT_0012029389 /DNA_START=257 /DNA_END=451 /DNA_ORIENTATION=-